jgi:hypothetical protein
LRSYTKRAGDALAPHLAKLLPKLYRMQHDPNPKMQEAVKGIWLAMVVGPHQICRKVLFRQFQNSRILQEFWFSL